MKGEAVSQRLVDEVTLFLHAMDGAASKAPSVATQNKDLQGRQGRARRPSAVRRARMSTRR